MGNKPKKTFPLKDARTYNTYRTNAHQYHVWGKCKSNHNISLCSSKHDYCQRELISGGKNMEKRVSLYTHIGVKISAAIVEKRMEASQNFKNKSCDSLISVLDIYQKE